jgi:hypothetical protein
MNIPGGGWCFAAKSSFSDLKKRSQEVVEYQYIILLKYTIAGFIKIMVPRDETYMYFPAR